jgi:hypothetical protein
MRNWDHIIKIQDNLIAPMKPTQGFRANFTWGEIDKFYKAVAGKCEICGKQAEKRNLALDHCHRTGALRGILCMKCNLGLGYYMDSPELLAKAIEYLRKHTEKMATV